METPTIQEKINKKKKLQFYAGQVFKTHRECRQFELNYELERNVKLSRSNTKTVSGSKVKNLAKELSYYEMNLRCHRSGVYKSKSTGKRRYVQSGFEYPSVIQPR